MTWSPREWKRKLENLVEQCSEQVLLEMEEEILAHLRTISRGMIKEVLEVADKESTEFDGGLRDLQAEVWYGFGVLNVEPMILPVIIGMEDSVCSMVQEENLGMIVCPVPRLEYNEEALHIHMQDLPWVESHARCHEEVLVKIMDLAPFIPMPFCTIFNDLEHVKTQLKNKAQSLQAELKRLGNHYEMYIKLFVNQARLQERILEKMPYSGGEGGNSYFQRLQWEKNLEKEIENLREDYGESLYQNLKELTQEAKLIDPEGVVEPDGLRLIFGAQFLLHKACRAKWEETIEAFDREADSWGFVLEVSGPWPPYHFIRLNEEEQASGGDSEYETSYASGSGGKTTG